MKKYIRCHIVDAEPMSFGSYCTSCSKLVPDGADPAKEGYRVIYPDGYVSWCPKEAFEAAGRPIDAMTFGQAIEAMKQGKKVARKGWNGKGMYIWVMPGSTIKNCQTITDPHLKAINEANGGSITFTGSIRMKTATGEVLTGWLASQTDMLSEDWEII